MTSPHRCPKCQSDMVQGFILDNTYGGATVGKWAPGPPRHSFWTGIKAPREDLLPIGTFRCPSCGFLESYARQEFNKQ